MDQSNYQPEAHVLMAGILMVAVALVMQRRLQQPPVPRQPRARRPRAIWCREWLTRRSMHGDYHHLLQELNREDTKGYKNFLRINPELFGEMVDRLTPILAKKATRMREPLSVGLMLTITLRFLATGDSYTSLQYSFRVSKPAICRLVPKVCQALNDIYKPEVLKCPRTPEEWNKVAEGFSRRWNYHNCVGALDGKHVRVQRPWHAGSMFFNYKKFHSIVLMAVADANYKFLYVDIGAEGSAGDGGTWFKCSLHDAIEQKRVGFPDASCLPGDDTPIPFHIVADDAFGLKTWLMKPYSHQSQVYEEKIYNYRLSRARRVVENAFGLLQARFRVFATTMLIRPEIVKTVTMCGCVLHNLILDRQPQFYPQEIDMENADHTVNAGSWRDIPNLMERLQIRRGINPTREAKAVRDYLALYYVSEAGAVPWQERMVYPKGIPADEQTMEV